MAPNRIPGWVSYCGIFLALAVCEQLAVGAYVSDHGQASDESAYFVTSLMICDYIRGHVFSNPLAFAKEYYAHFPRVALGHYPPMLPVVQAFLLLLFGRGGWVTTAFQAVVAGLCAGIPAALIGRSFGILAGLLAGAAVFLGPLLLFGMNTDMADSLLAVLVTLTAIAWGQFYRTKTWRSAIVFSAFASAAILTKGAGFGLALVPISYLALKADLRFLLNPKTLVAGLLVSAAVVPWYLFTYKLAAAGFVYSWGPEYTRIAAPFFLLTVLQNIGIPIAGFFLVGFYFIVSDAVAQSASPSPLMPEMSAASHWENGPRIDVAAFAAASFSQIVFPMLVPADLAGRYVVSAFPSIVVVAFWAMFRLAREIPIVATSRRAFAIIAGGLVVLSLASVYRAPHLEPFHSDALASSVLHSGRSNPLVLVSGAVAVEGAVISSFAESDGSGRYYVVRGSQVLSTGNFMGTRYALKFANPATMATWITKNKIGWIILADGQYAGDMPHTRILREALQAGYLRGALVQSVDNRRVPGGKLSLYVLPAANSVPEPSDPIFSLLKPGVAL